MFSVILNCIAVIIVCLIVLSPYFIIKEIIRAYMYHYRGVNWYTNEEREKRGIGDKSHVLEPEVVPKFNDDDDDFDRIIIELEKISFDDVFPSTYRKRSNRRRRR
jgi:hypothetical protein